MVYVETVKLHIEYCVVETDMIQLYVYYVVQNDGCTDWQTEGACSHHNIYTAVFFTLHSVLLLLTCALSWLLLHNFRIEVCAHVTYSGIQVIF